MILNRRTKLIRVIDFRLGALPAKRLFIHGVSQKEGVEKAIILLERDEVPAWSRIGFVKEGVIPLFYKHSDGYLLGCLIGPNRGGSGITEDGERLAEKTIQAAKRQCKEIPDPLPRFHFREEDPAKATEERDRQWQNPDGLISGFDRFSRYGERAYYVVRRGRRALWLSTETQECFGHSLIEILRGTKDTTDVLGIVFGLRRLCEKLQKQGIVSAFAFTPSDDVGLATAFTASGFRKTGLVALGVHVGGVGRKDAILWSRKLAHPGEGEE
ncbi:MAG: hypothetical protein N2515_03025 [Deltaproteobacteria bacterium]|nr:hypothetical protein [Deltaproteobacteria bacterium]